MLLLVVLVVSKPDTHQTVQAAQNQFIPEFFSKLKPANEKPIPHLPVSLSYTILY